MLHKRTRERGWAMAAVIAGLAAAVTLGIQPRPTQASAGTLDIAIVSSGGGNIGFWTGGGLAGTLNAAPGTDPWTRTTITTSQVNAATLSGYDVLVITGGSRSWVTATVKADVANWVQQGGNLILDPMSAAITNEPLTQGLGSGYRIDWFSQWCGHVETYPDPLHPLLQQPNVVTSFRDCDHVGMNPATLGSQYTTVAHVPSVGNLVVLAAATAGQGAVLAAGVHFDHQRPGQFRLGENMLRFAGNPNQVPVAKAKNVTVSAGSSCTASVSAAQVDDGSFDPDGDPMTLSLSPAGPYSLGTTTVTLTATDDSGATSTASATVTVVDTTAPTVSAPANQSVANDPGQCSAVVSAGSATAADNCPGVTVAGVRSDSQPLSAPYPVGTTTITWTATDAAGNSSTATQTITVSDNEAPTVTPPANQTAGNDPGQCSAAVSVGSATGADNCPGVTVAGARSDSKPLSDPYPVGVTTITWTATDAAGNSAVGTHTVTVNDVEAPVISGASADKSQLWPPNHKMVDVNVIYAVADNCTASGAIARSLSVSSNEAINGLGDGDTAPDWEIVGPNKVRLRAERSGTGSGRVYTITITATDSHGNSSSTTVTVTVPKSQGK